MAGRTVGDVLRDLIDDQLGAERASRTSLIQRSTLVITSAGVLISVCLTGAALVTRVQAYQVSEFILMLVGAAVGLFVISALVALSMNFPRPQTAIDLVRATLAEDFSDWSDVDDEFEISTYFSLSHLLDDMADSNRSLARSLTIALVVECAAIVCLSVGAVVILVGR